MFKNWRNIVLILSIIMAMAISCSIYIYTALESYQYVLKIRDQIHEVIFLNESKAKLTNAFILNAYSNIHLHEASNEESTKSLLLMYDTIQSKLQQLQEYSRFYYSVINVDSLFSIQKTNLQSKAYFEKIVSLYIHKGFKDYGIEGIMRKAIHKLESIEDYKSKVYLLTLRRHEKDFLLRKDESYISKFNSTIIEYEAYLNQIKIDTSLRNNLYAYNQNFRKIAEIEKQIGYSDTLGIRKEIQHNENLIYHALRKYLKDIEVQYEKIQMRIQLISVFVFGIFICVIITVILLRWYYLIQIEKPLKQIQLTAKLISNGRLQIPGFKAAKHTIFESVSNNLFLIVNKLKETMAKIDDIAENKFISSDYSSYDDIEKALHKLNAKIRNNENTLKQIQWSDNGIAKLNDLIRLHDRITQLYSESLREICKHTKAVQGCLYAYSYTEGKLTVIATYATNQNKKTNDTFYSDECLGGSCIKQQDILEYENVIDEFYGFTSGLGQSYAPFILCIPGIYQYHCYVVIELAFISKQNQIVKNYLKKSADLIAFSQMQMLSSHSDYEDYYTLQEGL